MDVILDTCGLPLPLGLQEHQDYLSVVLAIFKAGVIGHIILKNIENKAFFNGLSHAVNMKWVERTILVFRSEKLQVLSFGVAVKAKKDRFLCLP